MELFALLVALFAYLGPVQIEYADTSSVPVNDGRGGVTYALAKTTACIDGDAQVALGRDAAAMPALLMHELLHVADCRDNGAFDGSLEPSGSLTVPADPAHSWVYFALRNPAAAARLLSP